MKNDLNSLNDYLFEELERLNDDEELDKDSKNLDKELKRAKAITGVGIAIKWKSPHKNRGDEGFLCVKVQDGTKQNNWKQKHRLIWEQAYGPIPKGHKVIFKDGNRHNIVLDNLALVSNSQMLIMNRNNLIYEEQELTETGINIAKIIDKTNKLKK